MNIFEVGSDNLCGSSTVRYKNIKQRCANLPVSDILALNCWGVACEDCHRIIDELSVCPYCKENLTANFDDHYTVCSRCGSIMRVCGWPPRAIVTAIAIIVTQVLPLEGDII